MLYSRPDIRTSQCTIGEAIHYDGIALHSGHRVSMSLFPAPANCGIHFLRRDVDIARGLVTATWHDVIATDPYIVLGNQYGITVSMVGHLLAALRGCGVDNVVIEISGGEVPVFDGSCAPLVAMINHAGVVAQSTPRQGIWIDHFISVRYGEHYAFLKPSLVPMITVDFFNADSAHSPQHLSLCLLDSIFEREIAPARNPELQLKGSHGYASQSDQPAAGEPRFADELARSRLLECLGLMALADAPICGHLYLYNPGGFLCYSLLRELFASRDSWHQISYAEIDQLTGGIAEDFYQVMPDARFTG